MCKIENIALPREMSLSNKPEKIVRMSGHMHVMNSGIMDVFGQTGQGTDWSALQQRKWTF